VLNFKGYLVFFFVESGEHGIVSLNEKNMFTLPQHLIVYSPFQPEILYIHGNRKLLEVGGEGHRRVGGKQGELLLRIFRTLDEAIEALRLWIADPKSDQSLLVLEQES